MTDGTVLASFIAGSFAMASIFLTWFLKNRRSIRKVSAEEFIENFMKRQAEEIAQKDQLLANRDENIRNLEIAVRKWTQKTYRYETMIKELKSIIKKLKEENRTEKKQHTILKTKHETMKQQLKSLKGVNEKMYAENFVKAAREKQGETL